MSNYVSEIEFVLSECVRFTQMEPCEFQGLSLSDAFAMLPHPSGTGHMICGEKAELHLFDLATTAISRSQFSGRLDPNAVVQNLKKIITERFIVEKRDLSSSEADRAVNAAVKAAAKSMNDLVHLIPCHMVDGSAPDSFSIGPVTFRTRELALSSIEPALQAYLQQNIATASAENRAGSSRLKEKLLRDAQDYYDSFGWMAEVRINNCDPVISKKRAERTIQSALNCFHLLIGAAHSSRMRAGGPNYKVDRRSKIEIKSDGAAKISSSIDWHGDPLGESWWETIKAKGADRLIDLMGVAIEFAHDPREPSPLAQRFIDAADWYGEAVRDKFPASRLVKYVTAIERIVVTKNDAKLSETIADRGAAVMVAGGVGQFERDRKRIKNAYDMRSRIVHGSRSPTEPGMGPALREAEYLARLIVLSSLHSFRLEGLKVKELSTEKLDKNYDRLVEIARTTNAPSVCDL